MKRNVSVRLKTDPRNARKHGERNKNLIRQSLEEVGAFRSIGVDGSNIIRAGNGVYEQAQALGLKVRVIDAKPGELIAVRRPDLKGKRAERAALLDNRAGELSEWDADVIAQLAEQERELLDGLFDDSELREILDWQNGHGEQDAEPQFDKAAALQKKWGTATGQLWRIGEHRLLCGDSTRREDVERVMQGKKANGVFTSPPYAEQRKGTYESISPEKYSEWWSDVQDICRRILESNGSFFINIKPHREERQRHLYVFDLVIKMVRLWHWRFVDEFCWIRKGVPGGWDEIFKNEFEPVYHFAGSAIIKFNKYAVASESDYAFHVKNRHKAGRPSVFDCNSDNGKVFENGLALPGNVIEINGATISEHNAAFPVGLPEFFIKAFSDENDIWYDPFAGSGTTGIACEKLKRKARMIDVNPAYCAVALQRMSDAFPGLSIELLESHDDKAKRKARHS